MPGDCKVASPLFSSSLELLLVEGHLRWQILFNGAFQVITNADCCQMPLPSP